MYVVKTGNYFYQGQKDPVFAKEGNILFAKSFSEACVFKKIEAANKIAQEINGQIYSINLKLAMYDPKED